MSNFFSPGPRLTKGTRTTPSIKTDVKSRFEILPEVAHRFNAYAQAAFPSEIGGLLRIQETDNGFCAVDLKIFKQRANGAYFEIDPMELAKFTMGLHLEGREDEIEEWKSLIHSHPAMTPQMSGTDRENIELLAGPTYAFSVICSAQANPDLNYYAVHYAQHEPVQMIVHNLPVHSTNSMVLSGLSTLTEEEVQAIADDARELCEVMPTQTFKKAKKPSGSSHANASAQPTQPTEDSDDDAELIIVAFDTSTLNDDEYAYCDESLFELPDNSGYDEEEVEAVRTLLASTELLKTNEALLLADALTVASRTREGEDREAMLKLVEQLEEGAANAAGRSLDSNGYVVPADNTLFSLDADSSEPTNSFVLGKSNGVVPDDVLHSELHERMVRCQAAKTAAEEASDNGDEALAEQFISIALAIGSQEDLSSEQLALLATVYNQTEEAENVVETAEEEASQADDDNTVLSLSPAAYACLAELVEREHALDATQTTESLFQYTSQGQVLPGVALNDLDDFVEALWRRARENDDTEGMSKLTVIENELARIV